MEIKSKSNPIYDAVVGRTTLLQDGERCGLPMEFESRTLFLHHTIEVWQPYSKETLSLEDAQEIVENVTGFFKLLMKWYTQQRLGEEGFLDPPRSTKDDLEKLLRGVESP